MSRTDTNFIVFFFVAVAAVVIVSKIILGKLLTVVGWNKKDGPIVVSVFYLYKMLRCG